MKAFISGKKVFALEHEGKVIGSLGIEKYDEAEFPEFSGLKCREIGYVLSKDYWGNGLMPEAVGEVIRYLFEDLGADAIFCGYFVRNRQSARVQEKCGFKHYSTIKYQTRMEPSRIRGQHSIQKGLGRFKNMIRKATVADIPQINSLLEQVLMVHYNIRPDLFKPNTKKYTDSELTDIINADNTPIFVWTDEPGSGARLRLLSA